MICCQYLSDIYISQQQLIQICEEAHVFHKVFQN